MLKEQNTPRKRSKFALKKKKVVEQKAVEYNQLLSYTVVEKDVVLEDGSVIRFPVKVYAGEFPATA